MALVDDLLAHPGLYLGIDNASRTDVPGAARLLVTPLPGAVGVTLDYEVLNGTHPEQVRGHVEHTLLGRRHDGRTVMVIGHSHGSSIAILHETDPGTFELGDDGAPFPIKVVITMPEPGRLRHAWWYGPAGGEAVERDVAELTLES